MYRWTGPDNPDDKTEFSDYNYVDDAARANWQGEWRTPTEAEWSELVNNCTWVWDDNYNGTGIKGCLVTGGRPGYIDRSIFLPAAGYYSRTANNYQNYYGHYWASSLNVSQPDNAWYLGFYFGSIYLQHASRPGGLSIRPVIE